MNSRQSRLWSAPIALGIVTLIGLIAALIGDGAWDAVSWAGLGLLVWVCAWYGWLRRPAAGVRTGTAPAPRRASPQPGTRSTRAGS